MSHNVLKQKWNGKISRPFIRVLNGVQTVPDCGSPAELGYEASLRDSHQSSGILLSWGRTENCSQSDHTQQECVDGEIYGSENCTMT